MNLRNLFSKKATRPSPPAAVEMGRETKLDLAALDGCVGGRMETNGVDCYVRSTQTPAH